ncbi:two-component system sensor histidine kinase CreC [Cellvibrio sp. OA-2007]|uniref:two-component system sensor histidine kinase CreC n=1 Tax=Cellvibrio sp. OA-2007 TaxID=529823 RepID=UPI0007817396|nr:two-component system sensor histidine kinase CreC [Cellvibrio sp. OA-2007]
MKLSLRIFLMYFLLVGIGLFTFFSNAANQLRPIVRQSAENALIDTANLLAELVVRDLHNNQFNREQFTQAIARYQQRQLNASIWDVKKTTSDMRCYITDRQGRVIFHTDPDEIGKDYSRWLDVSKTLKGQYGARTTRIDPNDELTSVMHVAAPIFNNGDLFGVLTVVQPNASSVPFLEFARTQLLTQGSLILIFALAIGALLTYWLTHSVRLLSIYVQKVRQGERVTPPKLHERELAELAEATESMRRELEGKAYIENYVHTLTHEMKSPLAAIRGAAELLEEGGMEANARQKFLHNIVHSAHRMQDLIDRLLALAALENTNQLHNPEPLDLAQLVSAEIDTKRSRAQQKQLQLVFTAPPNIAEIKGDRFLLLQAISNLLDNALNFANSQSDILIHIEQQAEQLVLVIQNQGPWIPDYALPRIYERFYSLARAEGAGKSSGLGLSFVQEIAALHKGSIRLCNGGTLAQPWVEARLSIAR